MSHAGGGMMRRTLVGGERKKHDALATHRAERPGGRSAAVVR